MQSRHILNRIFPWLLLASVATVAQAHPSHEGEPPGEDRILDRFSLELSAINGIFDTAIFTDSGPAFGTLIRVEDQLGLDRRRTTPRILARWKIGRRHRVLATFTDDHRAALQAIDEEILIGDEVFPVNVVTDTDIRVRQIRAEWGYAFMRTRKFEAGTVVGLGLMGLKYSVLADATLNGLPANIFFEDDLTVPHPLVGYYNEATPYPWMRIRWGVRFLSVHYDDWEANIREMDFGWIAYPTRRLGIVLGYYSSRVEAADSDDGFTTLDIELDADGFLYGLIFNFGKSKR